MLHVLIITEDPSQRDSLHNDLTQLGCRVTESVNGFEAVKDYMRDRPELVLCDLHMIARSGLQTIAELRHFDPLAQIVAMGNPDRGSSRTAVESAMGLRAVMSVSKPVDSKMLALLIKLGDMPDTEVPFDIATASTLIIR